MAFERRHSATADATFSATGSTNWNANQTPSGADVGGIPYCPTATTETTSSKFTFDGATLTLAMGTVTTAPGAISLTQTRNASGTTFDAIIKAVITDTASAAGSLAMQILGGASGTTELLAVTKSAIVRSDGVQVTGNFLATGTGGIYAQNNSHRGLVLGGSSDTNVSWVSAGVAGVGTGTAGSTAGSLSLTNTTHAGYSQLTEMTAPAGAANSARLFAQDNGGGKTQLMVIFGSGVAQQIAIEA